MRLLKLACLTFLSSATLVGCGLFNGSESDNDNGGNNSEPVEYTLSTSTAPSSGGSVSPASGTFEEGNEVTVEATPTNGWAFVNWTGDQESSENPLTFTITSDTELTSNFEDQRSTYSLNMIATNIEDTVDLAFGQTTGASEGYDDDLDQDAPPPPPAGALNAYFEINDLNLLKDYRSNLVQQAEWSMIYQVDSGEDLTLEWTITDDTKFSGNLTLTDENGSFSVDMMNESSHTITGSTSGTLLIDYSFE